MVTQIGLEEEETTQVGKQEIDCKVQIN